MTYTEPAQAAFARAYTAPAGLLRLYRVEQMAAIAAIVLLMPFALCIAVAIFVLSRRGPLVRHWRVGQNGTPIGMLKFRTMWDAMEPRSPFFSIEDISSGNAPLMKDRPDPRVSSRFAARCRRHSLDELPQLYHVARGEMSLVGPRPLTMSELRTWYGSAASIVLTLRPGLTGLWQTTGRNRLTYPQRRRLDLFLARRASASFYFLILLRTVPRVLSGNDAY